MANRLDMHCCMVPILEAHRPYWILQFDSSLVCREQSEKTETLCINLMETAEKQEKTVWNHRGVLKGSKEVVKEDGLLINERSLTVQGANRKAAHCGEQSSSKFGGARAADRANEQSLL